MGATSSTNTTPDLSGPFSETAVYEIVANGEGGANSAIGISTILSSAPPAVPEPASLALLGQVDQARPAAQAGLALDPDFTIRRYRAGAPSDNPTFLAKRERIYEGMRMAGVPEG